MRTLPGENFLKQEIIQKFEEKRKIITSEALEYLLGCAEPEKIAEKTLEETDGSFIELDDVKRKKKKFKPEKVEIKKGKSFKPKAKDIEPDIKIFREKEVTGNSLSEGTEKDFHKHFLDRFQRLSKILRKRGKAKRDLASVKKAGSSKDTQAIGMINTKRRTKNNHYFMEIEDETGTLNVLVPKNNKKLIRFSHSIIEDEVIAVEGTLKNDLFIANKIIRPDIPPKGHKTPDETVRVAMISDTHFGSKYFMKNKFKKFLSWLNGEKGNGDQRKVAGEVKYLIIAGDIVDGIGIYPGQNKELEETDVFDQYEMAEEYLKKVPEHIHIIISPGNHDAVRTADPQPALPEKFMPELFQQDNVHRIGSPGYISLHGVEILVYHGASIHSMVPHIPNLTYREPEKVIPEFLKRRHMHPLYGGKPPISPEPKDYLAIDRVPDIVQVGDVHRNGYETYRGVLGVNSGTWQAETPFQVKQGHEPTPGELPVIDLSSLKINVIHFNKGEKK